MRSQVHQHQNCTHPVPPNKLGIIAMHCRDNQSMALDDLKRMIDGPLTAIQDDLEKELSIPA